MSLNTLHRLTAFDRMRSEPSMPGSAVPQSPASMRFMETGLALVAIAVALLLNLGR